MVESFSPDSILGVCELGFSDPENGLWMQILDFSDLEIDLRILSLDFFAPNPERMVSKADCFSVQAGVHCSGLYLF